jgi:hypothetical protein
LLLLLLLLPTSGSAGSSATTKLSTDPVMSPTSTSNDRPAIAFFIYNALLAT